MGERRARHEGQPPSKQRGMPAQPLADLKESAVATNYGGITVRNPSRIVGRYFTPDLGRKPVVMHLDSHPFVIAALAQPFQMGAAGTNHESNQKLANNSSPGRGHSRSRHVKLLQEGNVRNQRVWKTTIDQLRAVC